LLVLGLGSGAVGAEGPVLHDCPPQRRALVSLAGFDRMAEDRVARFSNLREFLCQDVHAESIIVYPGRVRRGRQALEVVANFTERPPSGTALRHRLRVELMEGESVVATAQARPWVADKPTRAVAKLSVEIGAARLAEILSRPDAPLLRLTLDVAPATP
jgi:hypothetical protein